MSIRRVIAAASRLLMRAIVVFALMNAGAVLPAEETAPTPETLRLGFTYSMFGDINENDAKASIKALATTIARERGLAADPDPHLFAGTDAVATALQARTVNAIGMTTPELWLLRRELTFDGYIAATQDEDTTETYVVLVPVSNTAKSLRDLQGRALAVFRSPRMSLALVWLDTELAKLGLPINSGFFDRVTESPKPSKVVLPVFFGQLDACIVNRRTLDTMTELNPQIGHEVRIVATSPPFTPSLFVLRGLSPPFHERALREFTALESSPAGQQVLTIFQTQHVRAEPVDVFQSAFALLEEHARLCATANAALIQELRTPATVLPRR